MKYFNNISIIIALILSITTAGISQATATTDKAVEKIEKQTLKIKGATCKKDLNMIVDRIKKMDGVKSCEIAKRGRTSKVDIEFNAAQISLEAIKATVLSTGTCEDPNARKYKVKVQSK